ncbi:hypothetical protein F5Y15DRAFT_264442 [Xylariaceae sp. FL0016]|nr:hypothetical protein F5Y15DRAFT_264442 [Xylariaceae sp. FL0016]
MPSQNISEIITNKPVSFNIKTPGGKWQCQIHSNRAAYEKNRDKTASPSISRTDSGLSTKSDDSKKSMSTH